MNFMTAKQKDVSGKFILWTGEKVENICDGFILGEVVITLRESETIEG